jgi:hypothetical protein
MSAALVAEDAPVDVPVPARSPPRYLEGVRWFELRNRGNSYRVSPAVRHPQPRAGPPRGNSRGRGSARYYPCPPMSR